MTRGRKSKPSHLLQGNPGKRAINHDEPQGEELTEVPPPPDWLDPIGIQMGKIGPSEPAPTGLTSLTWKPIVRPMRGGVAEQDIAKNGITVMGRTLK